MPYIISPPIKLQNPGEWFEGNPYEKENIYSIQDGKAPPVNYDKHILKPHSLTHIETPLHVNQNGKSIDFYFKNHPEFFYGRAHVIKFSNSGWRELEDGVQHKIIELEELYNKISNIKNLERILITVEDIPENSFGYHDPNYVVTLSQAAADYLASIENFKLFGTSWKSTDYMPGSIERPIHKAIFKKALILEYINLNQVPEGEYFINCFPLNLEGASESPVTAVLFELDELSF